MSITILKTLAGINGLRDLLSEPLMQYKFHVPASRGYRRRKSTQMELLFQLQKRGTEFDAC